MTKKTVTGAALILFAIAAVPGMTPRVAHAQPQIRLAADTGDAQSPVAGIWTGKLDLNPGGVLRIVVTVKDAPGGKLTAELKSPDQSPKNIPLDGIEYTKDIVTFSSRGLNASYRGTVTGNQVVGTFTQNGKSWPLSLIKVDHEDGPATTALTAKQAAVFSGTWRGALQAGAQTLHLVLHIDKASEGNYVATINSTDQGAYGLAATFTVTGGVLDVKVPSVSGGYHGTVSADHGKLNGTWTQGGANLPLNLHKV